MSRDYKNIKKRQQPEPLPAPLSNGISFLVGLALGLFIAVIVYFQQHNATIKMNKVIATPASSITLDADKEDKEEADELPQPQFAFYKILPNKKFNISEWESAAGESDPQTTEQPVMFILQVGSFKQFDHADRVKAKLALIGITADIQRVVINGHDVRHQVQVGPYQDEDTLKQAKGRLLANDLDFTLLKLKLEDI